jgi:putative N6-adenine-specific DNA methylase
MSKQTDFEIFLVAFPGLENALLAEVQDQGFARPTVSPGGVTVHGGWPEVWRANLVLRGVTRVLVRIGSFRALHLAQLDKRCRRLPWAELLRPDLPVRIEAAIKQRFATALKEELGIETTADASLALKIRMDDDLCTVSIDSSGESLHKRGHKEAVNKAPLRETLAALLLRECGYTGTEPVLDPMCGSGTIPIEAAEIAAGLAPGRSRNFAFEQLACHDASAWNALRKPAAAHQSDLMFYGSDRDAGAVRMSQDNAQRAGVTALTSFRNCPISDLFPPKGPCGLVLINPPYGTRIGDKKKLLPLYRSLGQTLSSRFAGWRVGLLTSEAPLAHATGLPFARTSAPIPHGGISVKLYQTDALQGA